MPAAFMALHHWSVSRFCKLNTAGSSIPDPHSILVKVLGPKCIKAMNSFFKAAYWLGVGTTWAALIMMESLESVSVIFMVLAVGINKPSLLEQESKVISNKL